MYKSKQSYYRRTEMLIPAVCKLNNLYIQGRPLLVTFYLVIAELCDCEMEAISTAFSMKLNIRGY
jgi:hypothetical protein